MLHTKGMRILLAAVLQTAIWLAVLLLDPFGMSTAADHESEEIYLRLFPAFYPDDQREKIQIVLLRDTVLPLPMPEGIKATTSWPLSYEEYVELIKKVLELKPKGVFVDLFFKPDSLERRDPKPLLDFIAGLKPGTPPVVFADFSDPKKLIYPEIHRLPFEGGAALRGLAELDAPEHYYPIYDTRHGVSGMSAAAVLYNATVPKSKRVDTSVPSPFLVAWSNTVDSARAIEPVCAPITKAWTDRLWGMFDAVSAGLDTKFNSLAAKETASWHRLQPCPHHTVNEAPFLMATPADGLIKQFRDTYVLIGADIAGSGDRVVSPVHGDLAGVHLHAAALDNLLTFEGRPPFAPDSLVWPIQAILIFITAVLGRLLFEDLPEPRDRAQALSGLRSRAVTWIVLAIAILVALLVNRWGPNNWGSVLAVAAALFFGGGFRELFVLIFGGSKEEKAGD